VTTLAQTATGIPLQLYCFTNTSAWLAYEAIQAAIFENVAAMLHRFDLYTFENPTGRDTLLDGYMSPGKNPDVLFGLPYPFFQNSGTPDNPGKGV
jgi:miniconductance mechanosensitive channel